MMPDPFFQIARVWVQRPLNWILILFLAGILIASTGPKRFKPKKAYDSPSPTGSQDGAIISSNAAFLDAVERGEVNEHVTGIDFYRMGVIAKDSILVPFSEVDRSLNLFPNIEWIHFSYGMLDQMHPGTLANLKKLVAVEVKDSTIRQPGLSRLAEANSLSWLAIESTGLRGTLDPLKSLPALRRLDLIAGYSLNRSGEGAHLLRPEVLKSLVNLKHLQSVVIDDTESTRRAAVDREAKRSLMQLKDLGNVWIGSQQTEAERGWRTQLAASLTDVSVRPARYDSEKFSKMLLANLCGLFIVIAAGLTLTSQFSTPQAMLIPNYARPHQWFFAGLLTVGAVIGVYTITHTTFIEPLPCASGIALTLAIGMVCLLRFGILAPQNVKSLAWFPIVVFLVSYGLILMQDQTTLGCSMDRFLLGLSPNLAIAILVASIACMAVCVRQYSNQHRGFAESSLPSVVTMEDFKRYQTASQSRLKNTGTSERRAEQWERKFDANRHDTVWGKVMRLSFSGPTHDVIRRFGSLALVPTLAVVALVNYRPSAAESLQGACLSLVGYMIAAAAFIPVYTLNQDRTTRSIELLRPVSRTDYIRERFVLAFLQVLSCLTFTLIYGSVVVAVTHGAPSVAESLTRIVVFAIFSILATGFAMTYCLIKNVFLAAILVFVELITIGVVTLAFTGTTFGGRIELFGDSLTMMRWTSLGIGATLAASSILFSHRLWRRMEFGAA